MAFLKHRFRISDIPDCGSVITCCLPVIFVDRFQHVCSPIFEDRRFLKKPQGLKVPEQTNIHLPPEKISSLT